MPALDRIAVIAAGPAGASAAAELVRAGRKVLLFDEKLAWEKPCGGGLVSVREERESAAEIPSGGRGASKAGAGNRT